MRAHLERARAGTRRRAGDDALGVLRREHQRRVAAHAEPHDVGLVDARRIEHGDGVTVEEVLAVEAFVCGRVGARIAARRPHDAAPAAAEMADLVVPAPVIAAELVDEQDGRALARLLEVDACALGLCERHDGVLHVLRHHAPGAPRAKALISQPAPRRSASLRTTVIDDCAVRIGRDRPRLHEEQHEHQRAAGSGCDVGNGRSHGCSSFMRSPPGRAHLKCAAPAAMPSTRRPPVCRGGRRRPAQKTRSIGSPSAIEPAYSACGPACSG